MATKTKRKPVDRTYTVVGPNIYKVGRQYRVRVSVRGTRYDEYLTSKAKAIKLRNELLRTK
jgi:hypothetical protein